MTVAAVSVKVPVRGVTRTGRGTMASPESSVATSNSAVSISESSRLEVPDPDVPIADGIAVILQHQRQSIGVWAVVRPAPVHRPTGDNRIVLHQHAIVEHRHARRVAYRVT